MKNYQNIATVNFPNPQNLQVNMLPFIMGDEDSLPEHLKTYQPLIKACGIESAELGKVGYLTITETKVSPGKSQRRGGVHVERHPQSSWGGGGWGRGSFENERRGGLYMASNVEATTAVWDTRIENPGPGGDCQHLESELKRAYNLKAGELIWLTDATPHASLPVKKAGIRQFFRLVTSQVELWYAQHSTPNPKVALPEEVQVIDENKFKA